MNKRELISRASEILRENDCRKVMPSLTKTFHITDDEGNTSHFSAKAEAKGSLLNKNDVGAVLEALLLAAEETIRKGDEICIHGFGTLGLKYRAERRTKVPVSGEPVTIAAHYTPKFTPGKSLRMAAKVYELSLDGVVDSDLRDFLFEAEEDEE